MKNHPEVGRGNVEGLTDVLGGEFFHFAECEGLCVSIGKSVEAVGEDLAEFGAFDDNPGVGFPRGGRGLPMAAPGKEVFGEGVLVEFEVGGGFFAGGFADVIDQFVFEDADEPGSGGRSSREPFAAVEGGQEGFLDKVLCGVFVAEAHKGIAVEEIAVLVDPGFGVVEWGVGVGR